MSASFPPPWTIRRRFDRPDREGILFVFLLMLTVFALNFRDDSARLDELIARAERAEQAAQRAEQAAQVEKANAEAARAEAERQLDASGRPECPRCRAGRRLAKGG